MRVLALAGMILAAFVGCDGKGSDRQPDALSGAASGSAAPPRGKNRWGPFKAGSFAKLRTVTQMDIAGTSTRTELTRTFTLKERADDHGILELTTEMPNATRTTSESKISLTAGEPIPSQRQSGTEEIEVAGTKMKCDWMEGESPEYGGTAIRIYTSEQVPGFIVKEVAKSASMTSTTEVVEWSAK